MAYFIKGFNTSIFALYEFDGNKWFQYESNGKYHFKITDIDEEVIRNYFKFNITKIEPGIWYKKSLIFDEKI